MARQLFVFVLLCLAVAAVSAARKSPPAKAQQGPIEGPAGAPESESPAGDAPAPGPSGEDIAFPPAPASEESPAPSPAGDSPAPGPSGDEYASPPAPASEDGPAPAPGSDADGDVVSPAPSPSAATHVNVSAFAGFITVAVCFIFF